MSTAAIISNFSSITLPRPSAPGAMVGAESGSRIKQMARELEATFLSLVLKEMRQSLEPDGGLFPGDSGDVQGGLFDLYLGRHLADAGGVGMAAVIERQANGSTATKSDAPPDAHARPVPVAPGIPHAPSR